MNTIVLTGRAMQSDQPVTNTGEVPKARAINAFLGGRVQAGMTGQSGGSWRHRKSAWRLSRTQLQKCVFYHLQLTTLRVPPYARQAFTPWQGIKWLQFKVASKGMSSVSGFSFWHFDWDSKEMAPPVLLSRSADRQKTPGPATAPRPRQLGEKTLANAPKAPTDACFFSSTLPVVRRGSWRLCWLDFSHHRTRRVD